MSRALLARLHPGLTGFPIAGGNVAVVAGLLGMILAFQSAVPMKRFGAEIFVADLIGLSMLRELGPLMTAIALAARSGSSNADSNHGNSTPFGATADNNPGIAIGTVSILVGFLVLLAWIPLHRGTSLALGVGMLGGEHHRRKPDEDVRECASARRCGVRCESADVELAVILTGERREPAASAPGL